MLTLAIISTCVLVTLTGPTVSGYTITHSQDYPGYSSSGFVGLKDNQDHGNYATASSHRYSSVGGGHSSSANYPEGSQSSSYGGHAGASTPDTSNTITASYQADSSSSDLSSNYSPSSQNIEYTPSQHGSTGSVSFAGYAGGQSSDAVEYSSPSSSYASQPVSYSSHKAASYSSPHGPQYSGSSVNYIPAGHSSSSPGSPSSSYSGSYPGSFSGSRHASYADGPRFSPSASLKSYLSGMHRESPASFHGPNYIHAPPSSSYSKGPGPSSFPFGLPKGTKIIIIKDSNGAHAVMHPESVLPGMFSPASSTYKVRSAGPFSSSPHYANSPPSYSHPQYSSGGGHSVGPSSSYFNFS